MKLGQKIDFDKTFEITSELSNKKLKVAKGDSAIVTKRGYRIINGEGRGKILAFTKEEKESIKGLDYQNIAETIHERLDCEFDIKEHLDNYDISEEEYINNIMDILLEIL